MFLVLLQSLKMSAPMFRASRLPILSTVLWRPSTSNAIIFFHNFLYFFRQATCRIILVGGGVPLESTYTNDECIGTELPLFFEIEREWIFGCPGFKRTIWSNLIARRAPTRNARSLTRRKSSPSWTRVDLAPGSCSFSSLPPLVAHSSCTSTSQARTNQDQRSPTLRNPPF